MGDGRSLCLECMESAIMDTGDCQPLYHAIRDFFEGMNMKLDQQIPMLLVERQALNEAINGEKYVCELLYYLQIEEYIFSLLVCRRRLTGLVLFRAYITCLRQGVYAFLRSRLLPVYEIRNVLIWLSYLLGLELFVSRGTKAVLCFPCFFNSDSQKAENWRPPTYRNENPTSKADSKV